MTTYLSRSRGEKARITAGKESGCSESGGEHNAISKAKIAKERLCEERPGHGNSGRRVKKKPRGKSTLIIQKAVQ